MEMTFYEARIVTKLHTLLKLKSFDVNSLNKWNLKTF